MSDAGWQAELLATLARHMGTHQVPVLSVDLHGAAELRTLDDPGAVAAWARSVLVEQLTVMPIPGQGRSAVEFSTELGGHSVRVWARIDGLPCDVKSLTVDELTYFADYATLPVPLEPSRYAEWPAVTR